MVAPPDCQPTVSARSRPYGRVAGRLYLPVEASLDPELPPSELVSLLTPDERVYVFHPAGGLIGYDPADRLEVPDLLGPPRQVEMAWEQARPGIIVPDRLLSIVPEFPPDAESLLDEGQEDIATQSPSLRELPRCPQEPSSNLLRRLGRGLQRQCARCVCWLTGLASRGKKPPPKPKEERPDSPESTDSADPAGRPASGQAKDSGREKDSRRGKASSRAAQLGGETGQDRPAGHKGSRRRLRIEGRKGCVSGCGTRRGCRRCDKPLGSAVAKSPR